MDDTIQVVGISGSLRRASTNTGLLRCAQQQLPPGMSLEILDIARIPLFNEDLEHEDRSPEVDPVLKKIETADALVFACPEYNHSIAPALKNIIDWASRAKDNQLLDGMPVAILGSAAGMGSSRAQYHLRQVCVGLHLLPLAKP